MEKLICTHPRAKRDYIIEETFEAGIVLRGSEVKSLRANQASIKESFAMLRNEEVFLVNSYVAPYESANIFNHDPRRERKLLLNKREISRLIGKTQIRGFTLIPTRMYFKNSRAKLRSRLPKVRSFKTSVMILRKEKLTEKWKKP